MIRKFVLFCCSLIACFFILTQMASAATAATMQKPTPGTTLPGPTVTFAWSTGSGISRYFLEVGTSYNSRNIYSADQGTRTSATVSNIPTNGSAIFVKLSSKIGTSNSWYSRHYTYTAYKTPSTSYAPAAMTSPAPGSKLAGTSATFAWSTGTNISQYSLAVASSAGGADLYNANTGAATSATVSSLPQDGRTLYVKLGSLEGSTWAYNSYTYTAAGTAPTASCSSISVGQGASLNGFVPFSATSEWRRDISTATTDTNSSAIINYIGGTTGLHPDFGAGTYNNSTIGIPYVVVNGSQSFVNVTATYADESDPGPMPIPPNAPIEGYPNATGDRHVMVIDQSHCWLYELYNASVNADGSWKSDAATVWDMLGDEERPYTWTSTDAAGLSIFEGLIRYDEVASGSISHAIRFTLPRSRNAFVLPARHAAANSSDSLAAPMGMRMRLRSTFDISGFSAANQVILKAMKKYGIIMADNGSSMYISGTPDDRWNNTDLRALGNVKASDFEVIQMGPIYTPTSAPTGAAPALGAFAASSTAVSAGTPITLNWTVSGASYLIISSVGPVRGTSVQVTPTKTTTYTIYATNQYGRTSRTVTVSVQ